MTKPTPDTATSGQLEIRTGCKPSSPERGAHREWIGGRAITLLSHYWRDDDPVELTAAIGADWADVLEGIPREIIQKACIRYQREEPRRKPTPGAIYSIAKAMMPPPQVVRPQEPPKRTLSEEEMAERRKKAREILLEAGATINQFGGVESI